MKFRKKPVVIEAITFDELVAYGLANTTNVVNGMPWSFEYEGQAISHENDRCYLIPTLEGTMKFTPDDMLITGVKGEIYPCKKEIFDATYESVERSKPSVSTRTLELDVDVKVNGLAEAKATFAELKIAQPKYRIEQCADRVFRFENGSEKCWVLVFVDPTHPKWVLIPA